MSNINNKNIRISIVSLGALENVEMRQIIMATLLILILEIKFVLLVMRSTIKPV